MKKISLLAIALIVSLPGCGCRKQKSTCSTKRGSIEKYMDTQVGIEDLNVSQSANLNDSLLEKEIEDELEAFDFGDDEDDILMDDEDYDDDNDIDFADDLDEDITKNMEFSWVDAQSDDEFKKLYFSFNHYGVREDQQESILYDIEQVKQLITESGDSALTVVVEGHTDQEGNPAYNLGLSEKRAKSVADLLMAAGIEKSLIKVVGRGQECPIVLNGKVVNGSREERAPNRRVEIRVIYT